MKVKLNVSYNVRINNLFRKVCHIVAVRGAKASFCIVAMYHTGTIIPCTSSMQHFVTRDIVCTPLHEHSVSHLSRYHMEHLPLNYIQGNIC